MSESSEISPEKTKNDLLADIQELLEHFDEDSSQYANLEDLQDNLDIDRLGNGNNSLRITVQGIRLSVRIKDDFEQTYYKVRVFVEALKVKINPVSEEEPERTVKEQRLERAADIESITEPIVPEKDKTYWRDVTVEIVKIAEAFEGTPIEKKMKDLRKKSHKRRLGKEDVSILIEGDLLEIWKGDDEGEILLKIARFVQAVQRHNPDKFSKTKEKATLVKSKKEKTDKIYWRDVIAGIDLLIDEYPDNKFDSLAKLREMLEAGEVGQGMNLLLNIGEVYLWIKTDDNDEIIKEKIAVFIGELKQIAAEATEECKEEPLDPELDKTYWRDILGALEGLKAAYGRNPQFKLLKLSIEKGILGTVKDFHAVIDGLELTIKQSDSDVEMKDKITEFIRGLTKSGQVKISDHVREKYVELEDRYRQLEAEKLNLETRYEYADGDLNRRRDEIRRLENENTQYEDRIRRLEKELQDERVGRAPAPTRRTVRSWSG